MPTQTRSQARLVQTTNLVTSLGASPPMRILRSRQGNAGVVVNPDDGSPSFIAAVGRRSNPILSSTRCKDSKCKTCPFFLNHETFKSNITNREYNVIVHTWKILTCYSSNIIYLLTCLCCGVNFNLVFQVVTFVCLSSFVLRPCVPVYQCLYSLSPREDSLLCFFDICSLEK